MGKNLDEFYQKIVNMPDEEKLNMAQAATASLLQNLTESGNEEAAINVYMGLIGCYVGVDGEVDQKEYEFFKSIFSGIDMGFEDFCKIVEEACSVETIKTFEELLSVAPEEIRRDFVVLGLAFCSCNDTITTSERRLLERFLP